MMSDYWDCDAANSRIALGILRLVPQLAASCRKQGDEAGAVELESILAEWTSDEPAEDLLEPGNGLVDRMIMAFDHAGTWIA